MHGAIYWFLGVGYVLALPFVAEFFAPVFHRLRLVSAYEILGQKYNMAVRVAGSLSSTAVTVSRVEPRIRQRRGQRNAGEPETARSQGTLGRLRTRGPEGKMLGSEGPFGPVVVSVGLTMPSQRDNASSVNLAQNFANEVEGRGSATRVVSGM